MTTVNSHALGSLSLGSDLTVAFYRTCRVPRSNTVSALPAGFGSFPIYKVSDFAGNVPTDWQADGHFLPMYPHEAMWMGFTQKTPVALMVGAGMVNAVTGERLTASLSNTQNYLTCPPQPWLDGFKPTSGDKVYQFVCAQLGSGETAEEQILGTAEFGGLQFGLFKPKIALISATRPREYLLGESVGSAAPRLRTSFGATGQSVQSFAVAGAMNAGVDARSMGLGAGGSIHQKIYSDPYLQGRDVNEVWHAEPSYKAYVYIVHANDFKSITGQDAPSSPITFKTYQDQHLPWFRLPDGEWSDVQGGTAIDALKPVSGGPHPTDADALDVDPATADLWK